VSTHFPRRFPAPWFRLPGRLSANRGSLSASAHILRQAKLPPRSKLREGITAECVFTVKTTSFTQHPSFKRTLSSPALFRRVCNGGSTPVRWSRFLRCHYVRVGVGFGGQSSSEEMQNSIERLTEKIHEVAYSFLYILLRTDIELG